MRRFFGYLCAAALGSTISFAAVAHGDNNEPAVSWYEVKSGDSWYKIATTLSPECITRAQRDAFVLVLSAGVGNKPAETIYPGQLIPFESEDVPQCSVTTTSTVATSTTVVSSTVAPTSTTVTVPPSTVSTTSTLPPSSGSLVPTLSQVGPRGSLASKSGTALPCGVYDHVKFTSTVELSSCAYTFTDVDIPRIVSRFASYVGPGPKVSLSHAVVRTGVWFEDGGHAGWSAEWTLFDGGPSQALRPKGPGTITLSDSLLLTYGTSTDASLGIHTESIQTLSGAAVIATRVGFSAEARWAGSYTPITAVVNLSEVGATSVFTDCEFGQLRSGVWVEGGGYFKVYPGQAAFTRPRIHTASGTQDGAWYDNRPPTKLSSPIYLK